MQIALCTPCLDSTLKSNQELDAPAPKQGKFQLLPQENLLLRGAF